jgi:soluble lytic murein transglycosylase-like protein
MYGAVGHLLLAAAILLQESTSPGSLSARDAQRESARRQVKAVVQEQTSSATFSDEFFLTPWPRPAGFADPRTPAASTASGDDSAAKVTKSSYAAPACDAIPGLALDSFISEAARRENLSADLLRAVVRKESAGYPCATSPKGAMGLMQLMPGTARQLGVRDPYNARQSIDAGARYLRELLDRYDGDVARALAAYNAGPGNVDAHGGVPPFAETQSYVGGILRMLRLDGL